MDTLRVEGAPHLRLPDPALARARRRRPGGEQRGHLLYMALMGASMLALFRPIRWPTAACRALDLEQTPKVAVYRPGGDDLTPVRPEGLPRARLINPRARSLRIALAGLVQILARTLRSQGRRFALPLCVIALTGCADLSYYWQAADGQLDLWRRSRPIEDWLADPGTKEPLKARLRRVQEIRAFASRELGLPDNGSYRSFADLQRPYLVWNVFAAPELSLTARQWCFPIAGCVTYRGYFAETPALALAGQLSGAGYDTYVGGVPAYSTLGWLDDPVPSTVIAYPDLELARLIFHELAHQVVYVPGDTTFNESFATAVEREGARRWALARGSDSDLATLMEARAREGRFTALILATRARLAEVYASPGDAVSKRAGKQAIIEGLRAEYRRLEADWGPGNRYARWFKGPLNNAQLASVAAYTERVPAFDALLAREGGDLHRFYAAVRDLARLPRPERDQRLHALAPSTEAGAGRGR